jgi:hypothetical protein
VTKKVVGVFVRFSCAASEGSNRRYVKNYIPKILLARRLMWNKKKKTRKAKSLQLMYNIPMGHSCSDKITTTSFFKNLLKTKSQNWGFFYN